jgi:hypothetical protein
MKLSDYLTHIGFTWNIVEKEKHYLIRYEYEGKKGHCRCTVKPYKTYSDPLNNVYGKKEYYPIDKIMNILLFNFFLKVRDKYNFKKRYIPFDDVDSNFIRAYYEYYPYDFNDYIAEQFKIDFEIEGPHIDVIYKRGMESWLMVMGYDFIDVNYFSFLYL